MHRFLALALVTAAAAAALAPTANAQNTPTAFVGATIIPIDGETIDDGVLIIENGTITAVGPTRSTPVPPDAQLVRLPGKVIMPGLVDTHSHIGGVGAADRSGPIQPGVRVYDSINVRSSGFRRAIAGGLTSLNIMPGSGHLSSGQTVYVKLRFGEHTPRTIDAITYRFPDGSPIGGLKMANGTNSIRHNHAAFPGTRGKSAFLVRETFIKAQEYDAKLDAATNGDGTIDQDKAPPRDLHLEALIEAMDGKRIVHHHTHRHDDILTVLRLADEFGFRVVLHHVSEGWIVADEIAQANAPCSLILIDSPGGKLEAKHLVMKTGRVLDEAGADVAFHTDDWITDSRFFFRMAALAVRAGMDRDAALEALTIRGAEMMDLQNRVGSLTPGKDADFIVLSGDPFSVYTRVNQTWVEGEKVFDIEREEDRLYAEGGMGASHDIAPYYCCYDHLINNNANSAGSSNQ